MAGVHRVVQRRLHPLVQHLFDLVGVIVVHRRRAHRVADDVHRFVVVLDPGILAEDRRCAGRFDMFLERDRICARQADQFEQKAQQVAVVGGLPSWPLEDLSHVLQRVLHRRHVVRDQECPDCGPADHDHLEGQRFEDDAHLAAGKHVAAEDHDEDDGDTDEAEHVDVLCRVAFRPVSRAWVKTL